MIRTKLLLLTSMSALLVFMAIIISWWGYNTLTDLQKRYAGIEIIYADTANLNTITLDLLNDTHLQLQNSQWQLLYSELETSIKNPLLSDQQNINQLAIILPQIKQFYQRYLTSRVSCQKNSASPTKNISCEKHLNRLRTQVRIILQDFMVEAGKIKQKIGEQTKFIVIKVGIAFLTLPVLMSLIILIIAIPMARSLQTGLDKMLEASEKFRHGQYDARVTTNSKNEIGLLATAFNEMAEQREEDEAEIRYKAHVDSLTDLPNRFISFDRLSQLISEAKRDDNRVAVLFIDLDDFKKINDTLGHESGDKVLVDAAQRLRNAIRRGDTVGRFGGDEFIILLRGIETIAGIQKTIDKLLNQFKEPFHLGGRDLRLTASIGIAVYPDDGIEAEELLRNADSAMYHSKEQGRNTYTYFTSSMNDKVKRRLVLEEQMHGAMERGEFSVVYQPKIDLGNDRIMGAEALLRWYNPELGQVSPMEFIPIAEKTGAIEALGEYILKQALEKTAKWQNEYDMQFSIAVNLSPRQFRDPGLFHRLKSTVKNSDINANTLELEITEGILMTGQKFIAEALNDLHELGVNIAMDDFGTGYSSLSYLRNYPFDIIKIDRSFVNDIKIIEDDYQLINATIAMAHSLNLKVVAEGVETQNQLLYLKQRNCNYIQGYLISKPVPPETISTMLKKPPPINA